ncbi:MAG: polysaccharide biosynthesis tyrosine autokinase [Chitinophagaceae bacterium]
MASADQDLFEENNSGGNSIKEVLLKYLSYWPLFLISLALCVGGGIMYLRYTTPKYMATAFILVKDEQSGAGGGSKSGNTSDDLIRSALSGEKKMNIDNELQLMRSPALIRRVVQKKAFNISYYKVGNVRNVNLHTDAPFELKAAPGTFKDSIDNVSILVKDLTAGGAVVSLSNIKDAKTQPIKWDVPFTIAGNAYVLHHKTNSIDQNAEFVTTWSPVDDVAADIIGRLSVDVPDKKTSIIQMRIITENLKLGPDILNAVFNEFYQSDLDEKDSASQKTIDFINTRLDIVTKELNGVEGSLENFRGANEIVSVTDQTAQSMQNVNDAEKSLNTIGVQLKQVEQMQNYFSNPGSQDKLVVSSLGIKDPTLSGLIDKFNEVQAKKEREAPLLASKSMILKDYDNQLNMVKGSIMENLQNISKDLRLQESSLQERSSQYHQMLSALPHKERAIQDIKRKQSITEAIYLYLLQKREETAISSKSSNISVYKQIDTAKGFGPIEPIKKNILMFAVLAGLILPIGFVVLKDMLNEKIASKKDITSRTSIPVVGEISHLTRNKSKLVSPLHRDILGEQFRIIRTNLSFFYRKKDKRSILITSSTVGEGKSFVSSNLASVLAMPGQKVALLEFDIRKPQLAKIFGLNSEAKGLTNYLTGQTDDLSELYQQTDTIPTMHIYTAGSVHFNPVDLLISARVPQLFEALNKEYDYVIVDSPPAGLVADALLLGEHCDLSIYVIREGYTPKKKIEFLNEHQRSGKLKNIGLVLNDMRTSGTTAGEYGGDYVYGEAKNGKLTRVFSFMK